MLGLPTLPSLLAKARDLFLLLMYRRNRIGRDTGIMRKARGFSKPMLVI
jgi:hypothetical protein